MKIVNLKQRESGTGSIHDIESQHYERTIKFRNGTKFAVVLAAYYGGKGYWTYMSDEAAIKGYIKLSRYSRKIIDSDGNHYYIGHAKGDLCLVSRGPLYCDL